MIPHAEQTQPHSCLIQHVREGIVRIIRPDVTTVTSEDIGCDSIHRLKWILIRPDTPCGNPKEPYRLMALTQAIEPGCDWTANKKKEKGN